jgi:outer membrane protein TolC
MTLLRIGVVATFVSLAACAGCSTPATLRVAEPATILQADETSRIGRQPELDAESVAIETRRDQTQVQLAQFDPAPPPPRGEVEEIPLPAATASTELQLADVIVSVEQSYPLIQSAVAEMQIADGKLVSAWGEFDASVLMYSINDPLGFYKNYRHGVGLKQPLWKGGYVYGEYRIGDGDFAPWYGEQETDEGGEFKVGLGIPLAKNRHIDDRRAAVMQGDLARAAIDPAIQAQVLQFVRAASQVYWSWVAAGRAVAAQQELLDLARQRAQQVEERVKAGDLEEIALINNQQLIASREAKLIESERKLQESAIKLSLFWRSPTGEPIVPHASDVPQHFPDHVAPQADNLASDIDAALRARPEFAELDLLRQQVDVDMVSARNSLLPKVDAAIIASKDIGGNASPKGDKEPFELEAALYGEMPLQRREGRGKMHAAEGKLAQLTAKRQFVADKVAAEVQDAYSGMQTAAERIKRAQQNVQLALRTRELGQTAFVAGDIDLVTLNIYEQAVNDAELQLIAAKADFFIAEADFHAATANQ